MFSPLPRFGGEEDKDTANLERGTRQALAPGRFERVAAGSVFSSGAAEVRARPFEGVADATAGTGSAVSLVSTAAVTVPRLSVSVRNAGRSFHSLTLLADNAPWT